MELDEQLAKLEKRNLREDTRLEIQQIAKHLDETMADLESKVADQLAKFSEAKLNLISFLDKANKFEEWLNEVEAELETYWPLGADLPLLLEKGAHINEVNITLLYFALHYSKKLYVFTNLHTYIWLFLAKLHNVHCY